MSILSRFHPVIAEWFSHEYGQPTDIQERGWSEIARGEHLLIAAPTGSGKTLAAFLWAINQLVTQNWPTGYTRVLYVSPLKALNNDIHRNLLEPLKHLRLAFEKAGMFFPEIRVQTRSGDTPQSDRRRMLRHPPEILITTPESLNLLLSSVGGRAILKYITTVILDEIHAVVGNKRGVYLIAGVDRLVPLCGEFQRLALSATIRPLETVAEFVGGFSVNGELHTPRYSPRPVSIVHSRVRKQYDLQVRFPEEAANRQIQKSVWEPLVDEFKRIIAGNRSTLLFVNSRRLCEKLTFMINDGEKQPIAYAHHGSLSHEIRREVERKLKAGELRAIVATNSLELGIDIGSLDEVVLIQAPPSFSSAIQRIGRAGHQVGEVSCGSIFPTHPHDLLEAAVLAPGIIDHDIEGIRPVLCPLDVLAQVIVSMVGVETWDMEALYVQLRTSYPYRHLTREHFDLVLNMLAGRYADSRLRELRPLVSVDRLDNTVVAKKGALLTLYTSGGVIPDRGYFHLRHHDTNAKIGELDEEFVWEASIGQTFTLGTQNWKIKGITHSDVFVLPGSSKSNATPFWKGEENGRDFHFSMRLAHFLKVADDRLDAPDFSANLMHDHHMDSTAAERLIGFLKKQREMTKCALPHRHHLVVEHVGTGSGRALSNQVILHTFWGGRVNRPYAMALDAAWEDRFGHRLEIYSSNDCIVLQLPHDVDSAELLSLVRSTEIEKLLRRRLEGSGFFGARFRECAGRSLLLSRNKVNERMPLWMSRLRSQKLLDSVLRYEDFPILLETWRTCLQDEFDLDSLRQVTAELENGSIQWSEVRTSIPSPMAQSVSWGQINKYMYMDDEPGSGKISSLRDDLFRELVYTPGLRPIVSREIAEQFELKRRRLSPGYSPSTSRDLIDWVKERLVIPNSEWTRLLRAIQEDHGEDPSQMLEPVVEKLVRISPPDAFEPLIVALEQLPWILQAFYDKVEDVHVDILGSTPVTSIFRDLKLSKPEEDRDDIMVSLLSEWLQFYGPTAVAFIRKTLGIESQRLALVIEDLIESEKVVVGKLVTDGNEDDICDSKNFEILLRLSRTEAAPSFQPIDIKWLPLFLASYQGLTEPGEDVEGLFLRMEQLLCYRLKAHLWESEILPARMRPYDGSWLDTIMQAGDLRWVGSKNREVTFCFESDLDLMQEEAGSRNEVASSPSAGDPTHGEVPGRFESALEGLLSDGTGRYDFFTLLRKSKSRPTELADQLWDAVWKGEVTNDSFAALRRGIETHFKVSDVVASKLSVRRGRYKRSGRSSFSRWRGSLPFAGNWFRLSAPELADDLIEIEERKKDRVRLLLDRYGILFRELLQRESPSFRWSNLFRTLLLMELSGEVLSGCFFHAVPGPQFISHRAFRLLQRRMPADEIYWINAVDPASLCGIQLDAIRGSLPKRVDTTHLVYRGIQLVLVSKRHGRDLMFQVPPEDPDLQLYLEPLRHLLTRQFQPLHRITIETINGENAVSSVYLDALRISFEVVSGYRDIILYRNSQESRSGHNI